jgi:hypothetical protein
MEKLKAILDNKTTWLTMGTFVGAMFGEKVAEVFGAVGSLVMAIL